MERDGRRNVLPICGNCVYHKRVKHRGETEWQCTNEESEYSGEFTGYKEFCLDFQER